MACVLTTIDREKNLHYLGRVMKYNVLIVYFAEIEKSEIYLQQWLIRITYSNLYASWLTAGK